MGMFSLSKFFSKEKKELSLNQIERLRGIERKYKRDGLEIQPAHNKEGKLIAFVRFKERLVAELFGDEVRDFRFHVKEGLTSEDSIKVDTILKEIVLICK